MILANIFRRVNCRFHDMIAGQVASTAISAAATAHVKSKDEVTLEIKLQNGSAL